MLIYLIRHGITDWNVQKRIQGGSDIPLNEEGRRMAEKTAKGLAKVPFNRAISSPLSRAKETAKILLTGRNIPIEIDSRLEEIHFGMNEGMTFLRDHPASPNNVNQSFLNFFDHPEHYQPVSGGETLDEVIQRGYDFIHSLSQREDCQNDTILITAHGCIIRAILSAITHAERKDFWGTNVPRNCSAALIQIDHQAIQLLEENKIFY